ncbi:MAG: hypothetical protein CR986_06205 [Ignavibacteriae bacterium]|nr:MAG: hypothetical protein CR986_06205 [Ignavibacteriota bacterium]
MSNILEDFMGSIGGEAVSKLSSQLGIDKSTAGAIIPQVLPMVLGGLKKQKDSNGGEERVEHILNKYGSSNVLDNVGDLFSAKAKDPNPDPSLGGLLGNAGEQASNLIGKQFNLDSNTATKIIPMVAPLVLGFLTKKKNEGAGLSGIASLLDQDGDGNILDDVGGFLLNSLGDSSSGGALGGLLGGILGGKK